MIPAGIAAAQVAFQAWKAATADLGGATQLDDDTLGGTYQSLSALLRDIEYAYGEVREELLRRIMATKGRTDP